MQQYNKLPMRIDVKSINTECILHVETFGCAQVEANSEYTQLLSGLISMTSGSRHEMERELSVKGRIYINKLYSIHM